MVLDLLYRLGKRIDLLIGLLLVDAVNLLQFFYENLPLARNVINIVLGQTPPFAENHRFQRLLVRLYLAPFHTRSRLYPA